MRREPILLIAAATYLDGDVPVDPETMVVGETACVFPYHHTAQDSIWISRTAVYRNPSGCIFTLRRLADGKWRIELHGVPTRRTASTDEELRVLGFIRLGTAAEVMR